MLYYEVVNIDRFSGVYGRYRTYKLARIAAIRASWSRRVVIVDPFGRYQFDFNDDCYANCA